ncbi:hypothetical protein TVAG_047180 [Trichomonas vaginalis G3]|uniref:Uncharacterized protein n=1 Tax=Trichomonas vaginalis (strain ATCC PRA-98 / G3) TaxID=412133 RepID=A2FHI5_TRIV3|nr:spectrin binding [Trichomonas vaginalis G3]EAX95620.1 hypothetical protein TVAG_047180 [Trichomonas vaginalis G3]KAI5487448.1 spectrin binding [Trichomonas vaginalis G3]|eukprot:XP_001308550.1 hypothetical protein [Trichomonas vaginalis G3]
MNIITRKYQVIERGNDVNEKIPFSIYINDEEINTWKHISIMISTYIHDEFLRDNSVKSVSKNLHLSCNSTIDNISEFFNTGILRFENDQVHNRDIFEVGKAFGIEFLTNIFTEFVKSTYKEINEENFYDIYDCATIQNDINKVEECISFFASKMNDFQEEYKIITIKRYGYDFFEHVLTSKSLKISNEDSLVNTIIRLSEEDSSFFCLLSHVRVEFCNNNSIKSIKKFSVQHSLESISIEVFERALLNRSTISPIHNRLQLSNTIYMSDKNSREVRISNIEEFHQIDISDENMRNLIGLSKTNENFDKIYSILEKASYEGDLSTIKFAVEEKYADVRNDIKNIILEAAWHNNLHLVKQLFNYGADILSRSNSNRTILHYFSQQGNLEGVKFALNFFDINEKNDHNYTPLHDAIEFPKSDCIAVCEYLSSQPNIDKNARNKDNITPIQCAINHNQENIVEILRKNGFTE